jgi:hypothetical protein
MKLEELSLDELLIRADRSWADHSWLTPQQVDEAQEEIKRRFKEQEALIEHWRATAEARMHPSRTRLQPF